MSLLRQQGGVALIELAISIFVMVSIAFGITEFGRAIYQYNTLAKAARDATRFLSTRGADDTVAKDIAKCLTVFGNPACTGSPLAPGLATTMVSICDRLTCPSTHESQGAAAPVLNLVTVTIGGPNAPYVFQSLVSFVVPDIVFGPISVTMKQVT